LNRTRRCQNVSTSRPLARVLTIVGNSARRLEQCQGLFGAEGLSGLDTQASTGRANRGEESNDRHDHRRDRQQRATEGAEHLAFTGPIDHERQHGADHDACRELQRRKEIGIRSAMGADAGQLLRSIFTRAAL
jgi:hypothetical protein